MDGSEPSKSWAFRAVPFAHMHRTTRPPPFTVSSQVPAGNGDGRGRPVPFCPFHINLSHIVPFPCTTGSLLVQSLGPPCFHWINLASPLGNPIGPTRPHTRRALVQPSGGSQSRRTPPGWYCMKTVHHQSKGKD